MYYFVSDIHLRYGGEGSRKKELFFVEWLKWVADDGDAEAVFVCGDIFDFWFEYQRVVPKGFVRVLAQLETMTERGIRVVFMAGNHDMWVGDYLREECGVEIYTSPRTFNLGSSVVYVAHGDNLNVVDDWRLRMLNKIFRSKCAKVIFSWLVHPDVAMKFGLWWSNSSRKKHVAMDGSGTIEGVGIRSLIDHSARQQQESPCDHYIYGHLHQSFQYTDSKDEFKVTFISDWSQSIFYARLNGEGDMTIVRV